MNVCSLLIEPARLNGSKTAIIYENQEITYNELMSQVGRLAQGLRRLGVKADDRVGLFITNRPDYVVCYFAAAAVGAVIIPLNISYKGAEISYIINDSGVSTVIAEDQLAPIIAGIRDQLNGLHNLVVVGKTDLPGIIPFQDLMGGPADLVITPREKDVVAQLIYTSGTTGHPKGALITHGNLVWQAGASALRSAVTAEDRVICVLPLFHAYAKLQAMITPLSQGATMIIVPKFTPEGIIDVIQKHRATIFMGVPTMYVLLINSPALAQADFTSLRVCGSGGAAIPVELIQQFEAKTGAKILEGYGLSESTVMLTSNPLDGLRKPGSVGLPISGVEVKIVDDNGNEVPVGVPGELIARGPNIMKGYYNKPEDTAEALRNGWLYTGDIAKKDEDGYLYIVDRKKVMYIRGGRNIYPRETEEYMFTHPKIAEVAVVGMPDPVYGEEGKAFIVLKEGMEATAEEISQFCRENMASYKVPRYIEFVKELPKNATGKILKHELKNRAN